MLVYYKSVKLYLIRFCRGCKISGSPSRVKPATHFSFSISMERRFMSVSLKSKLRFSLLKLRSGGMLAGGMLSGGMLSDGRPGD